MSIVAAELIARVAVQGAKEAEAELTGVGSAAEKAGGLMKFALVAGAIAVGVAFYESVKQAALFQQNLLKLYTTAGEAKSALGMVGQGILDMSVQVGIGANELLKAMYWVESAGFHGAAGLNVLRIAAEGAKTENSDLAGVAHALTGVLVTYASTNISAAQAMNVLIASVGQGATTLNDLSGAISNVLPAGNKFHLQLIDLTTAIATMTNQNDNAASAATHLRQVILALESPAKAGAKALAEIGLSADDLHKAMSQSLPGAIQLIIDLLGKKFPEGSVAYNDALKAIAGGNKQLMGLLELSGTSLEKWRQAVVNVTDAVKKGGQAVMGWADVQQNFNFKLDQFKAAIEKVAIVLGTMLLPWLGKILNGITPLVSNFASWATSSSGLAGFINQISDALNRVFGPIQGVQLAAKPLVDTFDRATGVMKLFKTSIEPLSSIFTQIGGTFAQTQTYAKPMLDTFDRATGVFRQTKDAANPLVPIFQMIATTFQNIKQQWDNLQPAFKYIKEQLVPAIQTLGDVITKTLVPAFQQLVIAMQPLLPLLKQLAPLIGPIFVDIAKGVIGALVFIALLVAGFLWIITTIVNVETWVQKVCKNIVDFFKRLYHDLVGGSIVPDLINAIVTWFAGLPDKIMKAIASLPGQMAKLFTDMAAKATAWGTLLINNFLSGLQAAWNNLVSWVNGALSWLAANFPKSPVTQGPLKGSEMWGYNFGMNIANGLTASTGAVQSALGRMLGFMGGGGSFNLGVSGSIGMRGLMPPSMAGGSGAPIIVYVMPPSLYLDSRQMAQAVGPQLAREIQVQTGWRKPV